MKRDTDIIRQLDQSENSHREQRLRTMRAVALALLLIAAVLFIVARSQHGQHPGWGYLEAFAEAAMVGAIADWFAVTALFRHPLGIPLWHTAIIPGSKDEIGKSFGNFVENHFVTEDSISERIRSADLARKVGEYLLHPANADELSKWAATGLDALMQMADHELIRQTVRETATRELARIDLSGLAGGCVDALVADNQPQKLLDAILEQIATYLADEKNHPDVGTFVSALVTSDSTVIRSMLGLAMPSIIKSILDGAISVRMNPDHSVRRLVSGWIADSTLHLKADPGWHAAIAQYQRQTLASDTTQAMLASLWDAFRSRLTDDLHSDSPAVPLNARTLIQKAGSLLANNTAVREGLNSMLETGSRRLVRHYRGEAGRFIEAQLATWTRDEMSKRIELAIGRDLQFIRINGTIVGGLAGLLIHALTVLV